MIAVISTVKLFAYSEKNTKNRNDQQDLVNLSSCHQLKWYLPTALRINFIVSTSRSIWLAKLRFHVILSYEDN